MGDLFDGEADIPAAFFTMSVGGSKEAAISKCREKWPFATLYVVGPCDECDGGTDEDGECCSACDGEGEVSRPLLE